MAFDTIRLLVKYLPVILQFASQLLVQRVRAVIHRFTYVQTTNPKHVIVIGGSFAGIHLGKRLAETLHSGYKVILVERNSHFNYTFNFPRYSVVRGREGKAFIPYDGIEKGKPKGAFEFVSGAVIEIRDTDILMEDGRTIEYEFLAIATGVTQSPPAKLLGTQKHEACSELQALQDRIFDSKTIAIVGAGAVGVQLACDIKTFYPDKSVTLIHSRKQLLPSWGYKLHAYVLEKLQELKIEVLLGERPKLTPVSNWQAEELSFSDGSKRRFDLIIPCTGQTANSSLLESFSPSSISPRNGQILVEPTLHISSNGKFGSDGSLHNIFALGDVAATGGAKMARAGMMQAEIVCTNILALITDGNFRSYVPSPLESSLKLSLGKDNLVAYVQDSDGTEILKPLKGGKVDLEITKAWSYLGAKYHEKDF